MGSNYSSLTVTWYDESDGYTSNSAIPDSDLKAVPLFTDTGTGEVNQLQITLIARDGKYITSGNIIEQYDRIRIQITDLDGNSYDHFFEILDIIPSQSKGEGTLITLEGLGIEYHVQQVHYSGSFYFEDAFTIGNDIADVYNANVGSRQPQIGTAGTAYNTTTKIGNSLPTWTVNHYDYGLFEDNCYNRFMDLIDKLGASVSSGGVLDFYELAFKTNAINGMDLRLFSSGAGPEDDGGTPVTIKNTDSINIAESEGGIQAATGNNILAWGGNEAGSLPTGLSRYKSGEQFFLFRPEWKTGIEYKENAIVLNNGKHYKATSSHEGETSTTFSTDLSNGWWTQIDMSTEFGDSVQYSPWTIDKAVLWTNQGTNPSGVTSPSAWATSTSYSKWDIVTADDGSTAWATSTDYVINDEVINSSKKYRCIEDHTSDTFSTDLTAGKWTLVSFQALQDHTSDGTAFTNDTDKWEDVEQGRLGNDAAGMFDSNMCMWYQDNRVSTWAYDLVNSDSDISTFVTSFGYTGSGGIANLPIGTRIMVGASPTGDLNATDPLTGKTYANSVTEVVEDSDGTHVWKVKYKMSSDTDSFIVRLINDHKSYKWNNSGSVFTEITTEDLGNDTFHLYHAICNVKGIDDKPNVTDSTNFPEVTSDGKQFRTNRRSAIRIAYNAGNSWVNRATSQADYLKTGCWINFGFPYPSNTQNSISEDVGELWGGTSSNQAPYFDFENMKWTSSGKRGYNETDSVDLGNISAIGFSMKMEIDVPVLGVVDGIATMRCTLYDVNDNVVVQDFELPYTNGKDWANIVLPVGGFSDYRSIKPRYFTLNSIAELLKPKETQSDNLFEWRNVKLMSIQLQNSYDEFGRFAPEGGDDLTSTTLQSNFGGNVAMTIDAFHFKKPLLVSSNDFTAQTIRSLEPQFMQEPHVILWDQLQNIVNTQKEIDQFRHHEYDLTTSGTSIFDIDFGDSFYLENDDIVFVPSGDRVSGETANKIKLVAKRIEYHLTKPRIGKGGLTRTIRGVKRFT